jgi:hypothetical protein
MLFQLRLLDLLLAAERMISDSVLQEEVVEGEVVEVAARAEIRPVWRAKVGRVHFHRRWQLPLCSCGAKLD